MLRVIFARLPGLKQVLLYYNESDIEEILYRYNGNTDTERWILI